MLDTNFVSKIRQAENSFDHQYGFASFSVDPLKMILPIAVRYPKLVYRDKCNAPLPIDQFYEAVGWDFNKSEITVSFCYPKAVIQRNKSRQNSPTYLISPTDVSAATHLSILMKLNRGQIWSEARARLALSSSSFYARYDVDENFSRQFGLHYVGQMDVWILPIEQQLSKFRSDFMACLERRIILAQEQYARMQKYLSENGFRELRVKGAAKNSFINPQTRDVIEVHPESEQGYHAMCFTIAYMRTGNN